MRLKLLVQYDGRGFHGWQKQDGLPTVQGAILDAFQELGETVGEMAAAGRTDAGVHAWGQVVHVDVAKNMQLIKYLGGLNRFLPESVRVARVAEVEADFHARYSALSRHYTYLLWDRRVLRPDLVGRVGHCVHPLDVEKMRHAIDVIGLGEMDFSGFRDAECQSSTPLCRILHFDIQRDSESLLRVTIGADHFLHHMVRNLLGTLVEIGSGKRPVTGLADVLAAKDRKLAAMTYSADGLYFERVDYKEHSELQFVA